MAYLNEKELHKLASAVATDLVEGEIPLNDSISKLAGSMDMNQEQIHRLCEATNNVAFSHIFKKKGEASDRLVDFTIADPKVVLRDQIKSAEVRLDESAPPLYELRGLQDQMRDVRTPDMEARAKLAAQDEKVRVRVKGDDGNLEIFSVQRGYWEMPMGTTNPGENRRNAAARIVLERTGQKVVPMNLDYAGMEPFKGKMYHTFTVNTDKLRRIRQPTGPGGMRPRIEYRAKKAEFEFRPETKPLKEVDLRTLRKAASHLRQQKLAADMEYEDTVVELRGRFRQLYDVEPFDKFEKKAAAAFGKEAEAPLNFVRRLMHKPEVDYDCTVLQKHAGFVDTDTREMALLQTAITAQSVSTKHAKAIELLTSREN